MKQFLIVLSTATAIIWGSCSQEKNRYIDLRTGEPIKVEKDSTGIWVNGDTRKPVYIYVDTKNHDTIYGKTGEVINGHVIKGTDNAYWYDADANEAGDYKKKIDDGDVKIKTDDNKIKVDGETGEKKVKND
jgi:hypothetical protein